MAFVFAVAVLNFLLGMALAVCRERWAARIFAKAASPSVAAPAPAVAPPQAAGAAPPAPVEDPQKSLGEALHSALRADVTGHRARLVELRHRLTGGKEQPPAPDILIEAEELTRNWLVSTEAACKALDEHQQAHGTQPLAARLRAMFSPALLQAEAAAPLLEQYRQGNDPSLTAEALGRQLDEWIEGLQVLRDERYEVQLAALRDLGGLESLSQDDLADPQTRLHNRLGLEAVHRQWQREHATAGAPWSMVMLDIDGFTQINRRLGMAAGDRLLAAFGGLADDLLRKDRGFDRAAHHRSDRFALFLGDTDLDDAVNAAERIRQTIEASSFTLYDDEVDLTVSLGVAAGTVKDDVGDLLRHAEEAVAFAREAGGNRTCCHTPDGPQPEAPRPYQVKGRVVKLEVAS